MKSEAAQVPVGGAVARPAAVPPSEPDVILSGHPASAYGPFIGATTTEPYHRCSLVSALRQNPCGERAGNWLC